MRDKYLPIKSFFFLILYDLIIFIIIIIIIIFIIIIKILGWHFVVLSYLLLESSKNLP